MPCKNCKFFFVPAGFLETNPAAYAYLNHKYNQSGAGEEYAYLINSIRLRRVVCDRPWGHKMG